MPGMSFEVGEDSLREGDGVLFYSDGLVEAHDPNREMFGFPRLQALVADHYEEKSWGTPLGGALLLRWRGLGAGGRHHFCDATTFRIPRLNLRAFVYSEVQRTRTRV